MSSVTGFKDLLPCRICAIKLLLTSSTGGWVGGGGGGGGTKEDTVGKGGGGGGDCEGAEVPEPFPNWAHFIPHLSRNARGPFGAGAIPAFFSLSFIFGLLILAKRFRIYFFKLTILRAVCGRTQSLVLT